jgi:SAM-dependent methyltransferase
MADQTLELRVGPEAVRLRYVAEPPWIYLLATGDGPIWPSFVLRSGRATIVRDGEVLEGSAVQIADSAVRDRLVRRFREEAGPDGASRWFGSPGPLIAIRPGGRAAPEDPHAAWVRTAFDATAGEYEARIAQNPVELRFRRRSISLLTRTFPTPARLLEIGSGPGIETIPMLHAGHTVVALDISEMMIARLKANAKHQGLDARLVTRVLRARDTASLVAEFGTESFDGAYSTFGALNLEPDLRPLSRGLGALLRPGSLFVGGAFNRRAIGEPAAAILSGHLDGALARRRTPAPVGSHRFSTDLYLQTVGDIRRAFADNFAVRGILGLGLALPPPNLAARADRMGVRWDRLDAWDGRLGSVGPLAQLSDQFLAVLVRTETHG